MTRNSTMPGRSWRARRTAAVVAGFAALLLSCGRPRLPEPELPLVTTDDAGFRAAPPALPAATTSQIEVPEVQTAVLANGLTVWAVNRPGLPYVALLLVARDAGTLDSTMSPEVMRLTTRSIVEGGTVWHDGRVIKPPLISGRRVSFWTGPTHSQLALQILKPALDSGLSILSRTLLAPAFGSGNLDQSRIAELKAIQNAGGIANGLLEMTVAAAHGRTVADQLFGQMEVVQRADLSRIQRCYSQRFRPETMALIAVGDMSLEEVQAHAEPRFGSWQSAVTLDPRTSPTPPPVAAAGRRVHFLPQGDTGQAEVLILQPAPPSTARNDELPFALMAQIAVGSMSSRSNSSLRHAAGITYGVHPYIVNGRDLGLMAINASFESRETPRAISSVLGLLEELQRAPVSAAELKVAKMALAAFAERAAGSNTELAALLGQIFADGKQPNWLRSLPDAIDAVTPADVQRVARRYLRPHHVEIGVAGPAALGEDLAELGELALYTVKRK